jgi:hypothetical protein
MAELSEEERDSAAMADGPRRPDDFMFAPRRPRRPTTPAATRAAHDGNEEAER